MICGTDFTFFTRRYVVSSSSLCYHRHDHHYIIIVIIIIINIIMQLVSMQEVLSSDTFILASYDLIIVLPIHHRMDIMFITTTIIALHCIDITAGDVAAWCVPNALPLTTPAPSRSGAS